MIHHLLEFVLISADGSDPATARRRERLTAGFHRRYTGTDCKKQRYSLIFKGIQTVSPSNRTTGLVDPVICIGGLFGYEVAGMTRNHGNLRHRIGNPGCRLSKNPLDRLQQRGVERMGNLQLPGVNTVSIQLVTDRFDLLGFTGDDQMIRTAQGRNEHVAGGFTQNLSDLRFTGKNGSRKAGPRFFLYQPSADRRQG